MVPTLACSNIGFDLLQPRRKTFELPKLVIRIASETDGAIVRYTDLMAVMQRQPFLFQYALHLR